VLKYRAAEQQDIVGTTNKLDKSLAWEGDILPNLVFISALLKLESLVAFLERLIIESLPLKDIRAEPSLCNGDIGVCGPLVLRSNSSRCSGSQQFVPCKAAGLTV
jgi:hypothetical protein